jgi:hypothetical protein
MVVVPRDFLRLWNSVVIPWGNSFEEIKLVHMENQEEG